MEKPEKLIVDGRRLDGRAPDELRPLKIKAGVLERADGSAYVELGNNKVFAAVYGPREMHPRHDQQPDAAVLRCRYSMAPFSVEDRKKPGPDRRSMEISKVTKEALEPVLFLELYPRSVIDVFIEVLQADAGTRTAGINAAAVALADAGVPMRDLVSSVAVGKVEDTIVLDLIKEEDQFGTTDMPVAIIPRKKAITLLQMDGHFTKEEFKQALDLAFRGCEKIYEVQRQALKEKYAIKESG
ncbi:MAG: exonuclease [Candidatus Hadarchaeum yellowstonense]|jgi:exosome complex component RRP41|uniref:Exosome complex component Rrp41 n=1 Tax=Hadarchaeum yellowstonense TaxID=1776334 RepID=A0A147JXY1_HADYE|nr:MAG: exonuclease [Candidatus Hadarchaeum yellowstonense]